VEDARGSGGLRHRAGATSRAAGAASLGVVLTCLGATLLVGAIHKAACAEGRWEDGRQYRLACYTDIVPLYGTEQLAGGRLPYLDACAPAATNCDEYPVLTMYLMRAAAWISGEERTRFFWVNAVLLTAAAATTAIAIYVLDARRALWFALAPSLALGAFVNWDLPAVALATLATAAYLRGRDAPAGVLLGLGAAAKLYPALLLIPFGADAVRRRQPDRAIGLWWWAAGTWLVVNVPFAIAAPSGWWEVFRFNGERPPDWDSLWRIACPLSICDTGRVNVASVLASVVAIGLVWIAKRRREPAFPRWQLAFPILALVLLLGKVYSPQFTLWLLPWFALVVRDLRSFVAFEVADVAVFFTRLSFFGEYTSVGGVPESVFEAAVVVRAAVLVWCVARWVLEPSRPLASEAPPAVAPTPVA
jgi:uncharacterized membrane protein